MYRLIRLLDPLIRPLWRAGMPGLGQVVELRVPGRRTGRLRTMPVTLLTVGDAPYVGHPNGPAAWTRNLEAAATVDIVRRGHTPQTVKAIRVWAGPEREAVIRSTWSQQPFPANLVYAMARDHIRHAGVYYRLVDVPAEGASPAR
jgi:F420H(2)-dependent quinone reductase